MKRFFLWLLIFILAGQSGYLLLCYTPHHPNKDFLIYQTPDSIRIVSVGNAVRWVKLNHPDSTVTIQLSDGTTAHTVLSLGRAVAGKRLVGAAGANYLNVSIPLRNIDLDHENGGPEALTWQIHPTLPGWTYLPGLGANPLAAKRPLVALALSLVALEVDANPTKKLTLTRPILSSDQERHYHLVYSPQESTLYSWLDASPDSYPVGLGMTYDSYDTWRAISGQPTQMPGRTNFADYHFPEGTRQMDPSHTKWVYTIPAGLSNVTPTDPLINLDNLPFKP